MYTQASKTLLILSVYLGIDPLELLLLFSSRLSDDMLVCIEVEGKLVEEVTYWRNKLYVLIQNFVY
jgi:hypothetical protein